MLIQNTCFAGSPKQPDGHKEDGILRVWIDGEKVVDMTNMVYRKYNNVSIDTLSFNSFFGGSSDSFRAKKTEVRPGLLSLKDSRANRA